MLLKWIILGILLYFVAGAVRNLARAVMGKAERPRAPQPVADRSMQDWLRWMEQRLQTRGSAETDEPKQHVKRKVSDEPRPPKRSIDEDDIDDASWVDL